jgi:hypothetical protein
VQLVVLLDRCPISSTRATPWRSEHDSPNAQHAGARAVPRIQQQHWMAGVPLVRNASCVSRRHTSPRAIDFGTLRSPKVSRAGVPLIAERLLPCQGCTPVRCSPSSASAGLNPCRHGRCSANSGTPATYQGCTRVRYSPSSAAAELIPCPHGRCSVTSGTPATCQGCTRIGYLRSAQATRDTARAASQARGS